MSTILNREQLLQCAREGYIPSSYPFIIELSDTLLEYGHKKEFCEYLHRKSITGKPGFNTIKFKGTLNAVARYGYYDVVLYLHSIHYESISDLIEALRICDIYEGTCYPICIDGGKCRCIHQNQEYNLPIISVAITLLRSGQFTRFDRLSIPECYDSYIAKAILRFYPQYVIPNLSKRFSIKTILEYILQYDQLSLLQALLPNYLESIYIY